MQYAIIRTGSAAESFELVRNLTKCENVMYGSFLFPYVDALVMAREEKSELYFSDKVILALDWLTDDSFEKFMQNKNFSYEIKSSLTKTDIAQDGVNESYERFEINLPYSFSEPYELRLASRNVCALTEIADRILKEYGGRVITSSLDNIFFEVEKSSLSAVLDRICRAKSAING